MERIIKMTVEELKKDFRTHRMQDEFLGFSTIVVTPKNEKYKYIYVLRIEKRLCKPYSLTMNVCFYYANTHRKVFKRTNRNATSYVYVYKNQYHYDADLLIKGCCYSKRTYKRFYKMMDEYCPPEILSYFVHMFIGV